MSRRLYLLLIALALLGLLWLGWIVTSPPPDRPGQIVHWRRWGPVYVIHSPTFPYRHVLTGRQLWTWLILDHETGSPYPHMWPSQEK